MWSSSLEAFFLSLALGPQSPGCPHATCLALSGTLCTDHVDGLDGLLRKLATSQWAILFFTSLPFLYSWPSFLEALLCGRYRSFVSLPHPGIQVTLAKGVFPSLDKASSPFA